MLVVAVVVAVVLQTAKKRLIKIDLSNKNQSHIKLMKKILRKLSAQVEIAPTFNTDKCTG